MNDMYKDINIQIWDENYDKRTGRVVFTWVIEGGYDTQDKKCTTFKLNK